MEHESKRAELPDERYKLMVEGVRDYAIVMLDVDGTIASWNSGAELMKGYKAGEILGKHFSVFYTPEDVAAGKPRKELEAAITTGRYEEQGWRIRKDGTRFIAMVSITALKDRDGHLRGYAKVTRDITAQDQATKRFRLAVEAAPNAMVMIDRQGKIVLANSQAHKMFGYTHEELIGKTVEILIPDRFRSDHPALRAGFFADPRTRPMGAGRDLYGQRKNGEEFPVEIGLNPLETDEGPMVLSSIIDITERRRAEERFRLAVEASPNAMIMVDSQGRIVLTNAQVHTMFAYRREDLIGQAVEILIPERFRGEHPSHRLNFFRNPAVRAMGKGRDLYGRRKNGQEFPIEIGLNPIETKDGLMVLSSIIDISERKQAEDERKKLLEREQSARAEAERANQMKDEFLAICSHELRTPLTPILGWTRMLRTSPQDVKDVNHALEVIERNARIEKQLIEDLLDISRILSGKLKLETGRIDPIPVIRDAIDSVRPAANAKSIRVEISLDSMVDEVTADPNRLQQIVWNLLSNAVKFSARGGIVRVQLEHAGDDVKIVVADEGEGISADFLPYIFDRFRQADSSKSRAHGGLGLGLSIVKNLVDLHGGSILAESPGKGMGSTFTVTLPRAVPRTHEQILRPPLPSRASSAPPEDSLKGLSILVVDDDLDTCDFLTMALRGYGASVLAASSARDARRLLEQETPDLLISDIGMPGEDGYMLIKKIRELNNRNSRIPAIALTAYAKQEDRAQALAAGFQAHMAKPVDPADLEKSIAGIVRGNP